MRLNKNNRKDAINPDHYKQYPIEVIDMMVKIWGHRKVREYCLMNAFKYRMRLGHKDSIDQDLKKEQWYLAKARDLDRTEITTYINSVKIDEND